jgi:hypothetical protein
MKTYFLHLFSLIAFMDIAAQEDFWQEDFGTGCNQGMLATSYASPNGTWTNMNTGANAGSASSWFVSAMENGSGEGNCGEVCGNNRTLHLGAPSVLGSQNDPGAAYYEGIAGFCGFLPCGETHKRIQSPVIDCSNYSDIEVRFLYMEGGNTIDNATLWYFDGNSWSLLINTPKTPLTCSPQGIWTAYSITLPASADYNANVKIGFEWINNDDGIASDPSFAVDDIFISGTPVAEPCFGDFNNDGFINTGDLLLLLPEIGTIPDGPSIYDMNGNGTIGADDLLDFLPVFGTEC